RAGRNRHDVFSMGGTSRGWASFLISLMTDSMTAFPNDSVDSEFERMLSFFWKIWSSSRQGAQDAVCSSTRARSSAESSPSTYRESWVFRSSPQAIRIVPSLPVQIHQLVFEHQPRPVQARLDGRDGQP